MERRTDAPARVRATRAIAILATFFVAGPLAAFHGASVHAADRYLDMPEPAGFEQVAVATTTAARTGPSLFLRGEHRLRRYDVTGSLIRLRRIDFGSGRTIAGGTRLRIFNGRPYLQIPNGTFAGWWVHAPSASPTSSKVLAQPAALRLGAGIHVGVRFYKDSRVRTRLAIRLDVETEFSVSRRAVFAGRAYYRLTSGPLAGRWISTAAGTLLSPPLQPVESEATLASWKALALVYRETDVTFSRDNGSTYRLRARMTDSMRNLVQGTLGRMRSSVDGWSDDMAAMDLDIVNVPHPMESLNRFGNGYWVGPDAVAADVDAYAPRGRYDSVFVVWQSHDDEGVNVPVPSWGLTLPPGSWANGAGYSSVVAPYAEWWWRDSDVPQEVFVHEWMHQVIFWHENNDRMQLDLHSGADYGYRATDGTWRSWLTDVMRGRVWDGDSYLGVGPELWAVGTPRTN